MTLLLSDKLSLCHFLLVVDVAATHIPVNHAKRVYLWINMLCSAFKNQRFLFRHCCVCVVQQFASKISAHSEESAI